MEINEYKRRLLVLVLLLLLLLLLLQLLALLSLLFPSSSEIRRFFFRFSPQLNISSTCIC